MASQKFPQEDGKQKAGTKDEDPFFIAVKISKEQGAVLIAVVTQPCQYRIPEQYAQGRAEEIAAKGLFHGTSDKTDIGSAQRDDTAQKDRTFSVVSKSAVGGKDGALQGGKAPHCLLQQRGASRPADAISKGGAA